MTLRRALRKEALPHIDAETIREVLHESSYSYAVIRSLKFNKLRMSAPSEAQPDSALLHRT